MHTKGIINKTSIVDFVGYLKEGKRKRSNAFMSLDEIDAGRVGLHLKREGQINH